MQVKGINYIAYKGIEIGMCRAYGYGQYKIHAKVGSISVRLHCSDSLIYDAFYDDEDSHHEAALKSAYNRIRYSCEQGIYQDEYWECGFEFED